MIGVSTQSAKGQARMAFTAEIGSTAQLQKALMIIREVVGVLEVQADCNCNRLYLPATVLIVEHSPSAIPGSSACNVT